MEVGIVFRDWTPLQFEDRLQIQLQSYQRCSPTHNLTPLRSHRGKHFCPRSCWRRSRWAWSPPHSRRRHGGKVSAVLLKQNRVKQGKYLLVGNHSSIKRCNIISPSSLLSTVSSAGDVVDYHHESKQHTQDGAAKDRHRPYAGDWSPTRHRRAKAHIVAAAMVASRMMTWSWSKR